MKLKNLFLMLFAVSIATAQVREYFFYINPDSLNLLYSRSIWDETYIPMKLVYNGVERSGEIRFKGHTSRRYPKKPFRVKLKKGQELDNYRFLGFNAMYTDKSLMREKIVWDLYKRFGRVTPETYYVNIYINDKNYGLYLFVERIDKTFELMPEKYGFNRGGTMYQPYDGTHCGDLFIPTDTADYYRCYEKQFPADSNYSDLIQLINQINTTPTENFHTLIDSLFYGDCVTDWLVLNALTSDGDTYNKNYYLYHDSVLNKWLIIPWDYDLTFGRNGDFNLPYPLDLLNDNFTYWYPPNTTGPDNPLKSKFFQNPILRARFNQKLDSLLRYEFTETKLYPYIDSLKNLIKEYVYKDEFKWGTNQEFEEQVEALKYFITARKFYLYKWLSNYWPGEKNRATLRITQTDTVYHFVDKIGRLLASVWLYEAVGLDSLTVEVFPDSIAPALPSHALPDKFVKRFYKITPHPQNARFKLKLRVEYLQEFLSRTEVGSGIADERFLKLHYFDGYSWHELDTKVNAYANTLTVDSLTEKEITGTILCAFLPQEYKQTWNKVDFKTWNKLNKVRFFDDKVGYIVGETSSIYMTTDGGNSWRLFSMGKQIPFKDVAFSDSSVFVVGDQGLLYKSKVGDTLWVQIPFVKSNLKKIEFFNRSKYGFILTADSGVYFTRDAGNSWERPGVHWGNDIAMSDTDKFIIAVRGGILTYYEDMLILIDPEVNFDLIRRESTSGKILLSGDGIVYVGHLIFWNWVKNDLGVRIKDVKFLDSSRIFLAGESGRIFYSKDGGKTWHLQPIGSTLDIYSIDFIDSLQGWATGISGLVLSTKSGGITLIQEDKSNIPEKFVLHQNYPNPFNSATVISFEIPNPGWVAIEIYDVLGRKVKTLYSGHTEPGHYQVHFDAKDIASGVYFYVLRAEKNINCKENGLDKVRKILILFPIVFILSCSGLIYRVDPGRIEKYENKILQIFHRNLSNGLPSRPDGFCYAIDLAEIMQSAVEIGDSILFSKAYEAIKKHYIIRDTWIDSAIVWRYKNDSEIDASGTAETIHCAFAIYLAYKKWGVEEYKKLSYSLAKAYIKHGYAPEPGKFLVKNYFNYGTRTLSENTYLINQRPDFLYLIGKENNDNDMIEKSKMMYNAIISGYVKNGFFHSLYDIGVKTIIPGSDGYYSPNGVFPLISSIDISLSIIEFNPKPAREILDFFHENFGRWSDFYTLNNDKFRAQTNYASAAVYSKIIEVYLKLGKSAKYKDMIKYIVGDLLPEKIDGITNLTERNLDSFYFELAITLRTLHKARVYGL